MDGTLQLRGHYLGLHVETQCMQILHIGLDLEANLQEVNQGVILLEDTLGTLLQGNPEVKNLEGTAPPANCHPLTIPARVGDVTEEHSH